MWPLNVILRIYTYHVSKEKLQFKSSREEGYEHIFHSFSQFIFYGRGGIIVIKLHGNPKM